MPDILSPSTTSHRSVLPRKRVRLCEGALQEIIERVLSTLVGLVLRDATRDTDALVVRFASATGEADRTLRVACAWRITDGSRILVASSDLLTPADPDVDLESFDWGPEGASWWDARLATLRTEVLAAGARVTTFIADSLGGFRLVCAGGIELDVFPNSSAAPHVETEFWRLDSSDGAAALVVGSTGVVLESPGTSDGYRTSAPGLP